MIQQNVRQASGSSRGESGQSIILLTFAFVGLMLIVGLAIDLGMVYIERIRLSRACDAAALAAASELPFEDEAQLRVIEALAHNGYDVNSAVININDVYRSGPSGASVTIDINTEEYRNAGAVDTADKIRVDGVSIVRMNIMQLIGISEAPVTWRAVAENVTNVDIALVLDRSGSMQEDTICFGCYEVGDSIYPAGNRYPLAWPDNGNVEPWPDGPPPPCDPVGGPLETIVLEAEFYDFTNRLYQRKFTIFGDSYWALQRPSDDTGNCSWSNSKTCGSSSLDQRGAYMMHMPHGDPGTPYTSYDPSNDRIPRLDYQVEVEADTYYVFVRAQGGEEYIHDREDWAEGARQAKRVYWGIDGSYRGETASFGDLVEGGYNEPVVGPDSWRWTRLSGSVSFGAPGEHTLNIWAGGLGFRLDKIILSTNGNFVSGGSSGEGPDETHGRDPNGLACNPCNANYGLRLDEPWDCNNLYDDLYDDDQPIRSLREAAKRFTYQLDPSVDQVGLVTYGTVGTENRATIDQWLQCVVEDGDSCDDFGDILLAIENIDANGNTNIPDGIRQGIEVFAHENSRSAAVHIMILMTDGQTNETDGLPSACWAEDLWPNQAGETDEQRRSRDCVVYYTNQAQEAGYVIYTISLGAQADIELLEYVAEETGAEHYNAPRMGDLVAIFDAIAEHIFLRLIK
jgi:Flp pilus assembly protein TadG